MLCAGLDLSRKRLDFHLLDTGGATVDVGASPPDADGLQHLSARLARHGEPIRAAIESMNGARFVHDRLELAGWQVEIADAQKVKGLAPLACKTDRIDAWVLAELARRDLVPAIWLPDRASVPSASAHAGGCTSYATARASSSACTPSCSPTASPVPSPTCSASAAGSCSPSSDCPSRGKARSKRACA
jgi:transposase